MGERSQRNPEKLKLGLQYEGIFWYNFFLWLLSWRRLRKIKIKIKNWVFKTIRAVFHN